MVLCSVACASSVKLYLTHPESIDKAYFAIKFLKANDTGHGVLLLSPHASKSKFILQPLKSN
jgi:hypothetical protein